ncbi:hypothetical protein TNCV_3824841 [Trichonephila clavipes]|nr:hypothetical protein TNCV_3824841 [Trichonephila clavipes]
MCQGLGIKARFVPVEDKKVWKPKWRNQPNNRCGELNHSKMIPVVRSFYVHKMCGALGLEVEFDPMIKQPFFVHKRQSKRKSQEFVPLVKSISVFKICEGLGIRAVLASPQEM